MGGIRFAAKEPGEHLRQLPGPHPRGHREALEGGLRGAGPAWVPCAYLKFQLPVGCAVVFWW